MNATQWTDYLRSAAVQHGFDQVGFCRAVEPAGLGHFHRWLENGYQGEMHYLADRRDAYSHPKHVLDGVKSIMVLTTNYRSQQPVEPQAGEGRVSCYAWGSGDYHDWIRGRLREIKGKVHDRDPGVMVRGVVDTAPLLEREFARLAGIGWQGKNTMLISKQVGSYFFLSCLLLDIELMYDQPFDTDHCGTCTACLEACPTSAFPQPHVLDATRCISYLTIEHRSQIAEEFRNPMGDWIFGCDICQEVCPWNRHAPITDQGPFAAAEGMNPVNLKKLFEMDDQAFRERFGGTPLWRTRRRGILRNAAIVLGNQADVSAMDALLCGLTDDEPVVRGASAWALGRIAASLQEADQGRIRILEMISERLEVEDEQETAGEMRRICLSL